MFKKNHNQCFHQRGTTLIELIITVGILSIIAVSTMNFFAHREIVDAKMEARSTAKDVNDEILRRIERDIQVRDTSTGAILATTESANNPPNRIGFTTTQFVPSDTTQTFTRTFISECIDNPESNGFLAKFANIDTKNAPKVLDKTGVENKAGDCLRALSCRPGEIPVVRQRKNNSLIEREYPDYTHSTNAINAKKSFGNCIMFEPIGTTKYRVLIDTLVYDETAPGCNEDAQGKCFKIISLEKIIPLKNVADINLLP